jgi:hypothetical protein
MDDGCGLTVEVIDSDFDFVDLKVKRARAGRKALC